MSELLVFQPTELKFPFELKKQISCSLRLINTTEDYVAFKVKTTSPKKYSVRPNAGVVAPQSSIDIIITMQAQREHPSDMQCKDKFLVQSVRVASGMSAKDVVPELFAKEDGKEVFEHKLKVLYVPPPQPPSPVAECADEGVSPTKEENADWSFSLSEQPKDSSEFESKITEARTALSMLEKERDLAKHQSQQLLNELQAQSSSSSSSLQNHGRFSLLFVFLVGLLGVIVGYYLRR